MASYKKIKSKWSVVFDMPTADGTRNQKRLSGYSSRREAELAYIGYKGENKVVKPKARCNFKAYFENYIIFNTPRVKESTLFSYETRFEKHILPFFENKDVPEITSIDVSLWQNEINKKGLNAAFKNVIMQSLRAFFNYCIDIEKIITENPCGRKMKFIDDEAGGGEKLIYEPEEYRQFRDTIKSLDDLVLFDVLYHTGARKGEVIALQWENFIDNKLQIKKTFSRKLRKPALRSGEPTWKLTKPKSKHSTRDVLLPQFLTAEFNALKKQKKPRPSDFIFGDKNPLGERHFENARDKYHKAAGVKRIRIHDFRHSHVSYLISQNVDIVTIAKRIGDTVETVLGTYAHLMPNKQQEMLDKIEMLKYN